MEVKGKEAINAPKAVNFLEASEIKKINKAETKIFIKYLKKPPQKLILYISYFYPHF